MKSFRFGRLAALTAALAGAGLIAATRPASPVDLEQGWTADQVAAWYAIPQGSRLIPQDWLMALEQPDNAGMFLDKAYVEGFRFLEDKGPLPLGFVPDVRDDRTMASTQLRWRAGQGNREPWVGMTCAACHTSDITYRGRTMRVEGGATLADFQAFLEAFNRALERTRDEPAKFDRFARRVLGSKPAPGDREMLRTALQGYVGYQLKYAAMNRTRSHYGYGRNDAFGYIFNKVALVDNPAAPSANEPSAPVSYPFLWNIPQHHFVQWNGSAPNFAPPPGAPPEAFDAGALGRNVGEVIGVFGDVAVDPGPPAQFESSADLETLKTIERSLGTLRPPRWPRALFGVDERLAAEGHALYRDRCAACHAELPRKDLTTRTRPDGTPLERLIALQPTDPAEPAIGTDPTMACNAATNLAAAGFSIGAATQIGPMPAHAPIALMLVNMVRGVEGEKPSPAVRPIAPPDLSPPQAAPPPLACKDLGLRAAYKARPLAGVWATAPYLHNGSVPTLYDLLLPAAERPKRFRLGAREFDPRRVGFVTGDRPDNDFVFDTTAPGDSNRGHDFGYAKLTERQRWAIVEYLKVIGE